MDRRRGHRAIAAMGLADIVLLASPPQPPPDARPGQEPPHDLVLAAAGHLVGLARRDGLKVPHGAGRAEEEAGQVHDSPACWRSSFRCREGVPTQFHIKSRH